MREGMWRLTGSRVGICLSSLAGRDHEEKEEQWLVFKESIVGKSSVSMPKPGPASVSRDLPRLSRLPEYL